jgi:hypothetical protein
MNNREIRERRKKVGILNEVQRGIVRELLELREMIG